MAKTKLGNERPQNTQSMTIALEDGLPGRKVSLVFMSSEGPVFIGGQERLGIYSVETGNFEVTRVAEGESSLEVLASAKFLKTKTREAKEQYQIVKSLDNLQELADLTWFLFFQSKGPGQCFGDHGIVRLWRTWWPVAEARCGLFQDTCILGRARLAMWSCLQRPKRWGGITYQKFGRPCVLWGFYPGDSILKILPMVSSHIASSFLQPQMTKCTNSNVPSCTRPCWKRPLGDQRFCTTTLCSQGQLSISQPVVEWFPAWKNVQRPCLLPRFLSTVVGRKNRYFGSVDGPERKV